jgi:hypothetical protein
VVNLSPDQADFAVNSQPLGPWQTVVGGRDA